MTAPPEQYCTFRVGPLFLGIEVLAVQEVIRAQTITGVPLAPAAVRGLINLRGHIVTAVDLRQRLGLPDRIGQGELMNVVVRTGDGLVSLLVDEIGDVVDLAIDAFESPPSTLDECARSLIRGVYKLPDSLMLVLDVEGAIAV